MSQIINCKFCGGHHNLCACPAFKKKCKKSGEIGHFEEKCFKKGNNHGFGGLAYMVHTNTNPIGKALIESEASNVYVQDAESYRPCSGSVTVANGKTLAIIGEAVIPLFGKELDAQVCPEFKSNLVSVSSLQDASLGVYFPPNEKRCLIVSKALQVKPGSVIENITREAGMYAVAFSAQQENPQFEHER